MRLLLLVFFAFFNSATGLVHPRALLDITVEVNPDAYRHPTTETRKPARHLTHGEWIPINIPHSEHEFDLSPDPQLAAVGQVYNQVRRKGSRKLQEDYSPVSTVTDGKYVTGNEAAEMAEREAHRTIYDDLAEQGIPEPIPTDLNDATTVDAAAADDDDAAAEWSTEEQPQFDVPMDGEEGPAEGLIAVDDEGSLHQMPLNGSNPTDGDGTLTSMPADISANFDSQLTDDFEAAKSADGEVGSDETAEEDGESTDSEDSDSVQADDAAVDRAANVVTIAEAYLEAVHSAATGTDDLEAESGNQDTGSGQGTPRAEGSGDAPQDTQDGGEDPGRNQKVLELAEAYLQAVEAVVKHHDDPNLLMEVAEEMEEVKADLNGETAEELWLEGQKKEDRAEAAWVVSDDAQADADEAAASGAPATAETAEEMAANLASVTPDSLLDPSLAATSEGSGQIIDLSSAVGQAALAVEGQQLLHGPDTRPDNHTDIITIGDAMVDDYYEYDYEDGESQGESRGEGGSTSELYLDDPRATEDLLNLPEQSLPDIDDEIFQNNAESNASAAAAGAAKGAVGVKGQAGGDAIVPVAAVPLTPTMMGGVRLPQDEEVIQFGLGEDNAASSSGTTQHGKEAAGVKADGRRGSADDDEVDGLWAPYDSPEALQPSGATSSWKGRKGLPKPRPATRGAEKLGPKGSGPKKGPRPAAAGVVTKVTVTTADISRPAGNPGGESSAAAQAAQAEVVKASDFGAEAQQQQSSQSRPTGAAKLDTPSSAPSVPRSRKFAMSFGMFTHSGPATGSVASSAAQAGALRSWSLWIVVLALAVFAAGLIGAVVGVLLYSRSRGGTASLYQSLLPEDTLLPVHNPSRY